MTDNNQKSVFISYRRKPSRDKAERVRNILTEANYEVFLDVTDMKSGDWKEQIKTAILTYRYFLLLISPGTFGEMTNDYDFDDEEQDNLMVEIRTAIYSNRDIIPIGLYDNEQEFISDIKRLPKKLSAKLQSLQLTWIPHTYFDYGMERLIDQLLQPDENNKVVLSKPTAAIQKLREEQNEKFDKFDTVVVKIEPDDFNEEWLNAKGNSRWYFANVNDAWYSKLKYIAFYQSGTIRAITHYAEIKDIKPWNYSDTDNINFYTPLTKFRTPIQWKKGSNAKVNSIGYKPRYTSLEKLRKSDTLDQVWG